MDESNVPYKVVRLDSLHAKQMCWEDKGGSLGKIWCEVVDQMLHYENNKHDSIDKSFEETVERAMNEINQENKKSLGNQYIKPKAKSTGKSKEDNIIFERKNQESPLGASSNVSRGRSAAKPKLFIRTRLQGWRQKRKVKNSATTSHVGGAVKKRKVFTERLKLRTVRRRFVRGIGRRNRDTEATIDEIRLKEEK